MKHFLATFLAGAAGFAASMCAFNTFLGFGKFDLTMVIGSFIIGLITAAVGLAATYLCRRKPSDVGAHTLVTVIAVTAISAALLNSRSGDFSFLAILSMAIHALMTGLAGGLVARRLKSDPPAIGAKPLAIASGLVATLVVLTLAFPDRLEFSDKVKHVTSGNFTSEVTESKTPVLVDFSATWCGPCRLMAKDLNELAHELDGKVKCVSVDVEESPELQARFEVTSLPTLILIVEGEPVAVVTGAKTLDELRDFVKNR